jgi:hypothetical protein
MGFGNHIPYVPKEPVSMTFGMLRDEGRGFTVECRRCSHASFFSPKAMRYPQSRLLKHLELSAAIGMFRCCECQYDIVRLIPEVLDYRERHDGQGALLKTL